MFDSLSLTGNQERSEHKQMRCRRTVVKDCLSL